MCSVLLLSSQAQAQAQAQARRMRHGKCAIMATFSHTRRRLWYTAVKFGRYNLALARRFEFFSFR